jgi:tryptophan synthase alpha chain
MNGIEHISEAFAAAKSESRAALMPYYTLGYPTADISLAILEAIAGAGADLIEVGIPFSDPLADGPTIQHSTQVALENGMNTDRCLELTAELRQRGVNQPVLLMGYYNPMLAYGLSRFAADAAIAGADGFIIPDLPPEEAGEMEAACQENQLALVYLLSPAATPERIHLIAERTSGFLYLVSLTGVTGARKQLAADLTPFITNAREKARTPVAVGFGISTPQQAREVGRIADGVIVGSALINAVDQAADPCRAAGDFVAGLRRALQ